MRGARCLTTYFDRVAHRRINSLASSMDRLCSVSDDRIPLSTVAISSSVSGNAGDCIARERFLRKQVIQYRSCFGVQRPFDGGRQRFIRVARERRQILRE